MSDKNISENQKIYDEAFRITNLTYHMNSEYSSRSNYFESVYNELKRYYEKRERI